MLWLGPPEVPQRLQPGDEALVLEESGNGSRGAPGVSGGGACSAKGVGERGNLPGIRPGEEGLVRQESGNGSRGAPGVSTVRACGLCVWVKYRNTCAVACRMLRA
eukprot:365725-Chlamydomonas_euryale.AAC.7